MQILYPEAEHNELILRLREAVDELTDSERELINALYYQCKGATEIAREYNLTEGAIRKRRNKILNQLREMVKFG